MLDWRWMLGAVLMVAAVSGCGAERAVPARIGTLPRASERAVAESERRGPRPARARETEPLAASEPQAAPIERRRCELGASSARGFFASDAWPAGQVVLTFDDGPHRGKTPKVLDLLARHGMVATFFLVGRNIDKKTFRLVQRMVAEGHTLASHSYNHDVEMAARGKSERTIEYIRGQHEVTQILIEMALVANDEADFEQLYERVFDKKNGVWLASGSLRKDWATFAEKHTVILRERGFGSGERPYPIVYSRPPGGGPYVADGKRAERAIYDAAMDRLGFLNVLWHGESGDAHPDKKHDYGFLTGNLRRFSKRGGILLIHDHIRTDALAVALAAMDDDPGIVVVPIEAAVEQKYRCATAELREAMGRPRAAVLSVR